MCMPSTGRSEKVAVDPLEPELWMVVVGAHGSGSSLDIKPLSWSYYCSYNVKQQNV